MNQRGIVHLLPVLLTGAAVVGVIFLFKNYPIFRLSSSKFQNSVSSPIPSPFTPTPQPSPLTLTLTVTPTPSLTPTPTPSSTPKPTSTPQPSPTATAGAAKPTSVPISGPPGAGYSSITVATPKGNFTAKVLSVDLNSARAVTDTANDGDCSDNCSTLSLKDFVIRNGGFAGVNGSYFCPASYLECSSKKDSFDFPVYNTRLGHWVNGGNLFWNSRSIIYFDGNGAHYKQNAKDFSVGCTAGIVNYPGLVDGSNVQIDDNQSGLSDKQKAKGTKVGIGIRGEKNVIVVIAYSVNMQEFAHIFKSLGATGALNLDTGGSTALYYSGSYLAGPGRNIPNAIIFAK